MEQHNNNQKEVDKRIAIESSKHISKNRALAQFKECFHHKDDECKGPIVRAHSLQENGKLSLLEAPVNGQNKIYSFSEIISYTDSN